MKLLLPPICGGDNQMIWIMVKHKQSKDFPVPQTADADISEQLIAENII